MKKNKMQNFDSKKILAVRSGMSFVEAIMGIFIFGVLMIAVTNIFASSFNGYKKSEKMARNIEDAQYAIGVMTKSLRTSQIISPSGSFTNAKTITAYDYSEVGCNEFSIDDVRGIITRKFRSIAYVPGVCDDMSAESANLITTQYVRGSFSGVGSVPPDPAASIVGSMGKVTIRVTVCSNDDCAGVKNDTATFQTSVSLRDYSTVGL